MYAASCFILRGLAFRLRPEYVFKEILFDMSKKGIYFVYLAELTLI